jgi:hypothetical protein
MAELLKTKWVLRNHTEQSLLALPTLEDKRRLQAMSIINMMAAFAYYSDMNLFAVMNLRMVRWTVRYGVCRYSPNALATYAVVLCNVGEFQAAQVFGASYHSALHATVVRWFASCASDHGFIVTYTASASMQFSDRLNATSSRSKTISFYALVAPWRTPFRRVIKMVEYGYKLGMKTGEVMQLRPCAVNLVWSIFPHVHFLAYLASRSSKSPCATCATTTLRWWQHPQCP